MHSVVFRSAILLLFLLVELGLIPQSAQAWNAVGHMVVARLAYQQLTADERDRLAKVLERHPHYAEYLSARCPKSLPVGEWATMQAGVWPDWIRPPKRLQEEAATHRIHRFHRGMWHYVNFPFVAHQPNSALPAEPLPAPTNILAQLERSLKYGTAKAEVDPDAEPSVSAEGNRAVRLCWLIHLAGDLHQPLHAAALIDERRLPGPTHGDQGGNLLAVRVEIGANPIRLHSFWDQLPGTDNHPDAVIRLADELARNADLRPTANDLRRNDFKAWAGESYAAAKRYAYLDGDLPTAVWIDPETPPAVDDVPILAVGVEHEARAVARRRIVLAGARLAESLRTVLQ